MIPCSLKLCLILAIIWVLAPMTVQAERNDLFQGYVEFCIRYSAAEYELNEDCLLELAFRESHLDTHAIGLKGERGLFQWRSFSWRWIRRQMGADPDYELAWDPWENAITTAYAIAVLDLGCWWSALPFCECEIRKDGDANETYQLLR